MITRVYRGAATAGLMRYLYGPGRHEEHKAAHMVACWDGSTVMLEPAGFDADQLSRGAVNAHATRIAKVLDVPLAACPDHDPAHVYHLVLRNPEQDRLLTDAEWAAIGEDAMHRTGIAPRGDAGGCRWVMVRHGDDHVHLVATLARQDGARPRLFRDFLRLRETAADWEQKLGLARTGTADKTAAKAPTLGETHKAERLAVDVDPDEAATVGANDVDVDPAPELDAGEPARAQGTARRRTHAPEEAAAGRGRQAGGAARPGRRAPWTSRERLARAVHTAASCAAGKDEFVEHLQRAGVQVHFRLSDRDGAVTGVSFSLAGDPGGIRYGGGKLAPDLTWPKLRARWTATTQPTAAARDDAAPAGERAWREAERIVRDAAGRIGREGRDLDGGSWAAGETARSLAWLMEGDGDGPLHAVADDLARAGREPKGRLGESSDAGWMLASAARMLAVSARGTDAQVQALILALAALARSLQALREAQDRHAAASAALRAEQRLMAFNIAPVRAADDVVPSATATLTRPAPPAPSPAAAAEPSQQPSQQSPQQRRRRHSWLKPTQTPPPGSTPRPGGPGGPPRNDPRRSR